MCGTPAPARQDSQPRDTVCAGICPFAAQNPIGTYLEVLAEGADTIITTGGGPCRAIICADPF